MERDLLAVLYRIQATLNVNVAAQKARVDSMPDERVNPHDAPMPFSISSLSVASLPMGPSSDKKIAIDTLHQMETARDTVDEIIKVLEQISNPLRV